MPRLRKSAQGNVLPAQSTNGALPSPRALPPVTTGAPAKAAPGAVKATASRTPAHQTHGAVTPLNGPITHAQQLYRGQNVAKGSIGSFKSVESYGAYLDSLTDAQLQAHAANEAHLVPIDDRRRLKMRLETEWHKGAARTMVTPKRAGYTPEQLAAHKAIGDALLNRLK